MGVTQRYLRTHAKSTPEPEQKVTLRVVVRETPDRYGYYPGDVSLAPLIPYDR